MRRPFGVAVLRFERATRPRVGINGTAQDHIRSDSHGFWVSLRRLLGIGLGITQYIAVRVRRRGAAGSDFLLTKRGYEKMRLSNYMFLNDFHSFSKKDDVSAKKHLRVSATNRRTPLTGGAEAHNGTPDGKTERRSRGPRG